MTILQPATRRRRDGPRDHGSQGTPSLLQENDVVKLGVRPPGVRPAWDDCGVQTQALIVAFDQTRAFDESEREARMLGARMPGLVE